MKKVWHEFRDPIHGFIRVSTRERKIIDSVAVQRLRHIHQLSLSYLVYPGATHKRFEHSLGVMELAGMVYDVITSAENLTDDVRELLPEVMDDDAVRYGRTIVRLAALLHDVGHLPFSHGAEHELLPQGTPTRQSPSCSSRATTSRRCSADWRYPSSRRSWPVSP